ncbi:hypothetical protein ABPG72_014045, partial [Tetrahymena utriculariae]
TNNIGFEGVQSLQKVLQQIKNINLLNINFIDKNIGNNQEDQIIETDKEQAQNITELSTN